MLIPTVRSVATSSCEDGFSWITTSVVPYGPIQLSPYLTHTYMSIPTHMCMFMPNLHVHVSHVHVRAQPTCTYMSIPDPHVHVHARPTCACMCESYWLYFGAGGTFIPIGWQKGEVKWFGNTILSWLNSIYIPNSRYSNNGHTQNNTPSPSHDHIEDGV